MVFMKIQDLFFNHLRGLNNVPRRARSITKKTDEESAYASAQLSFAVVETVSRLPLVRTTIAPSRSVR